MKLFIRSILQPLLRRVGTAFAAYLVAQGVPADTTQQIVTGLSAGVLVGADLFLSFLAAQKEKEAERGNR